MHSRKIPLIILTLIAACSLGALEPPTRAEIDQYLRDGSFPARLQNALALGNHRIDPALLRDFKARLRRMVPPTADVDRGDPLDTQALPPVRRNGLPAKGNVHVFALLIDFPDYPAVNAAATINAKLFGDGDSGWPYESLRNYYRRSSYNLLEIGGTTLGWYRPAHTRASMPQTAAAREALIKEAIQHFHNQGHNFAQYDNDNNGTIDYFIVIWTGPNNGWANFWWGYQTAFSSNFSLDGKSFAGTKYSWQWESRDWPGPYDQIVVMHETGHALGLPDYYDYDATVGPGGGLGGLDMMDADRGDHNCFSKMLLDWLTPQVFNYGTRRLALAQAAAAPDALALMPEFDSGSPFSEFFMVQNRTRGLNDAFLPGDGLLVWHVDARLDPQGTDFAYDNSYTSHKLLRLMEADGLEQIEKGLPADAPDYYTQGLTFGPQTVPPSGRYDGTATGVTVMDISASGPTMTLTADVHYALGQPAYPVLQRVAGDFIFFREYINRLTWSNNSQNRTSIVQYRIFKRPSGADDTAYVFLAAAAASANPGYDHKGLKKDEFYKYRIIAVDKNGVESAATEVGN
jgi:M6 family metalloprotease-like protein